MDAYFDELASKRRTDRGRRDRQEPRTLIAKAHSGEGKGQLYISGIPTEQNKDMFLALNPSFQVCCMAAAPEKCPIGKGRHAEHGITLPGLELSTFEISHDYRLRLKRSSRRSLEA